MPSTVPCISGVANVPLFNLEIVLTCLYHKGYHVVRGQQRGYISRNDEWTVISIFPFFNRNMYKGKEGRTGSEGRDKDPSRPVRGSNPFCCVVCEGVEWVLCVFPGRLKTMRNTTLPLGRLSTAICNYWSPYSRVRGYCFSPATVWEGETMGGGDHGRRSDLALSAPRPSPRRGEQMYVE